MIIIDIGACIGEFIDYCIEEYNIENIQKIYAFEPLKANYNFLVEKYKNNDKITIFNTAISNFAGTAPFYMKHSYNNGNFPGNEGCSLKKDKNNLLKDVYEMVKVNKISTLIKEEKIDILKIDSEGSEYDIIEEIINSGFYKEISKIYFEDHAKKVPSIVNKKSKILNLIKEINIKNKFFEHRHHGIENFKFIPLE